MTRKRVAIGLLALVVLAAAGAGAAWWWNERQTRDVRGSSTQEFVTTERTTTRAETRGSDRAVADLRPEPAANARCGRLPARAAVSPRLGRRGPQADRVSAGRRVRAGSRTWRISSGFSARSTRDRAGRLEGTARLRDRGVAGGRRRDRLPAAHEPPGTERETADGFMLALDAENGDELWRFRAGPVESSPLLHEGTLYFGTFDRRLYALNARTGEVRWSFETDDRVKGAPAFWRGTVFTGSYDGRVYALDAESGELRWSSESQGGLTGRATSTRGRRSPMGASTLGTRTGRSTRSAPSPVISLVSLDGELRLFVGGRERPGSSTSGRTTTTSTRSTRRRATCAGPSTRAGRSRVRRPSCRASSTSRRSARRTFALDAGSGEVVWELDDGEYTPLVADRERAYIVGRTTVGIHAFESR